MIPLRNVSSVTVRHLVLQVLGLTWEISFSIAIYTVLGVSILGHTILIATVVLTVARFTVATQRDEYIINLTPVFI